VQIATGAVTDAGGVMHRRVQQRSATGPSRSSVGVIVATCVAVGALSGCGVTIPQPMAGSSSASGPARDVVSTYVAAIVDNDSYEACDQYTAELRARLARRAAKRNPQLDTCHEILEATSAKLRRGLPHTGRSKILREMRDPDNVHVQVDGDTARAWLQLPGSSQSSTNVVLVNRGGTWRISSVGLN
jgi:hypothetical protein